jgi:hypothetical protein
MSEVSNEERERAKTTYLDALSTDEERREALLKMFDPESVMISESASRYFGSEWDLMSKINRYVKLVTKKNGMLTRAQSHPYTHVWKYLVPEPPVGYYGQEIFDAAAALVQHLSSNHIDPVGCVVITTMVEHRLSLIDKLAAVSANPRQTQAPSVDPQAVVRRAARAPRSRRQAGRFPLGANPGDTGNSVQAPFLQLMVQEFARDGRQRHSRPRSRA